VNQGWTIGTLKEYEDALRAANDRRYTEVNIEKEKALKIKEEADRVALSLAREIQTYKDEAHNGLLKQWQLERGTYITTDKFDATVKPILEYISSQQGRGKGSKDLMDILKVIVLIASFLLGYFVLK
jgi:hypothetical protein